MTPNELRDYLNGVSGYKTDADREIIVSINRAAYGEISTIVIEWQGSPPRTRTIVYFYGSEPQVLRISEYTPRSLKKKIQLGKTVLQFLKENGYL